MPFTDQFVTVGGRCVAYVDEGPRNAFPVVLLHGGGFDHAELTWKPTVFALRDRFRLIVPDLPGYGRSDSFGGAHDLADLGRWTDRFMTALGLARADIAGVSMGGGMALWMAIHRPSRVRLLMPVGAYGLMARLPLHPLTHVLSRAGALRLAYATASRHRTLARIGLGLSYSDPSRIDDATLDDLMAVAADQGRRRTFDAFLDAEIRTDGLISDLSRDLARVTAPTLLVHGRRDRLVPLAASRKAARLIPGARLRIMDAGHWPMRELPGAFAEILADFLSRAPGEVSSSAR